MSSPPRYFAIVPAAGSGVRMGAAIPKQYLALGEKTVLEHAFQPLLAHPRIRAVVVALAADDEYWQTLRIESSKPVTAVAGGASRCQSVFNALAHLSNEAADDDWVLVHDAARPCVRAADIDKLMDALALHPIGGLLGMAVRDTMKRADAQGRIIETPERAGLWHALTPQMFRYGLLVEALRDALEHGVSVTDEAAALERLGYYGQMVAGSADNIKITYPSDLALAELYLRQQNSASHACA